MTKCEICYEQYPEDQLEMHRETCLVRLMFRCSICNEDYVNREGLWSHLDLHENVGDKELHCQELQVKYKLHQCLRCNDQRAYSESSYQAHVRNIHGNCGAQVQLSASDFHVLNSQNVQSIETNEKPNDRLMVVLRSDTNNYAKSELFLTQGDNIKLEIKAEEVKLQEQKNEHSESSLDSQGSNSRHAGAISAAISDNGINGKKEPLENKEDVRPSEHQETAEICSICKRSFSTKCRLRYHKIVSHAKPRYECSICRKKYYFSTPLRTHSCTSLRCQQCNKIFRCRKNLDKHNIEKHSHGSAAKDDAAEAGITADTLNEHGTTTEHPALPRNPHRPPVRDELVLPCSKCKLTFDNRRSHKYHMIVHHTEPQHKCSFCQKMYHRGADCRRHEKTCAEVRCAECGTKFPTSVLLNGHSINEFTEPRPECSYCQKMFQMAYRLRTHEKVCSELRCHKCGFMFSSRERLQIHYMKKVRHDHIEALLQCEAEQKLHQDHVMRGEKYIPTAKTTHHISTIDGRIQRWMAAKEFKMPGPHVEVQVTENLRATVKCWLCPKTVLLSRRMCKNGSVDWIISNFMKHILIHMQPLQNASLL